MHLNTASALALAMAISVFFRVGDGLALYPVEDRPRKHIRSDAKANSARVQMTTSGSSGVYWVKEGLKMAPARLRHDTNIHIINATPYRWAKDGLHSYQMQYWKSQWPDVVDPGQSVFVWAKTAYDKMEHQDCAGEVAYRIEGTPSSSRFEIAYQHGKQHNVSIRFLDDMRSLNNPVGSAIPLDLLPFPGGVLFSVAGRADDFLTPNPPAAWMQSMLDVIGELPLRSIVLPRSHASGMSDATKHFGGAWAADTRMQQESLRQQLDHGIRVIDVTPLKWEGQWYASYGRAVSVSDMPTFQGSLGLTLEEMVNEANSFLEETSGELLIWDVHVDRHSGDFEAWTDLNAKDLMSLYGDLKKLNYRGSLPDESDVTRLTLNHLIQNNTSRQIININAGSAVTSRWFPGGGEGFTSPSNFPVYHGTSVGESDVEKVLSFHHRVLHEMRPSPNKMLYSMDWVLTPERDEGSRKPPKVTHMDSARMAWSALYEDLWKMVNSNSYPNWIGVNGVHNTGLTAFCMTLNQCLAAGRCGSLGGKVSGEEEKATGRS